MDIAYAAHTESCTFMLDAEGICRWVVASNPSSPHKARHWEKSQQAAARCIGAQYVASLDVTVSGGLVDTPRVGVPMLFARVDENGRVSLVRTGPVLRFEDRTAGGGQPPQRQEAYDSGMRERPVEDPETRRIQRGDDGRFRDDDERTTPFQLPQPQSPPRARRAAAPTPLPVPPPHALPRHPVPPPPTPPRMRGALPPPPTNKRPTVPMEQAPPPEAHRTSAQPLWTDRAVALRRAR